MKKTTLLAAPPRDVVSPSQIDHHSLNKSLKALAGASALRKNDPPSEGTLIFGLIVLPILLTTLVVGGVGYAIGLENARRKCIPKE